jgi:LppX/LprAFG-like lipoprotein
MPRLVPFLALVPLAALAAACGSGGGGGDPVAKAATASANAKAEHMHLTSTVTANGDSVSVTGDGDFTNDPLLGSLTGVVRVGSNTVTLNEVASGLKIYLSSAAFKGQIPGGKAWMSIDYAKVAKSVGISLVNVASQSPTDALKQLQASGHAKKVGEETVNGAHTTHYVATIDPAKAAKISGAIHTTVTYDPVDVWVDDQGHVAKEHLGYGVGKTATTPPTRTVMTMTLSDYGESVHVSVPSASDTFDATALVSQATSTNGGNP